MVREGDLQGGWVMVHGRISVDLGGNLEGIWVESEDGFGLASNPAQSGAWARLK